MIGKLLRIKDDLGFFLSGFQGFVLGGRLWVLHSYLGTIRITVGLIGFQRL